MIPLLSNPLEFIITIVGLVIGLTIHEFSHALAADRLGDPTPRMQKRLTLNPLAHLDPVGTAFLIFFGFGWGKPVQYDPFNLTHPRRDAAIIALAGPASNILIAILFSVLFRIIPFGWTSLFLPFIYFNVMLALFNFIPIYPLDGFRIVGGLLNEEQSRQWQGLERYGMLFLIALIFPFGSSSMLQFILSPVLRFVLSLLLPLSGGFM